MRSDSDYDIVMVADMDMVSVAQMYVCVHVRCHNSKNWADHMEISATTAQSKVTHQLLISTIGSSCL